MPLKRSQVTEITKYKYTVSNANPYVYKNRTQKSTHILPIRNWFKFTRTKRLINNDNGYAGVTNN